MIFSVTLSILIVSQLSHALPTGFAQFDDASMHAVPMLQLPVGAQLPIDFGGAEGAFINMDVDGAVSEVQKKKEKLPNNKISRDVPVSKPLAAQPKPAFSSAEDTKDAKDYDFTQPQPGVAPKFTGSFVTEKPAEEGGDVEYFNFGEGEGPVVNPAATYLEGANFDKIAAPKCRLVGCTGPVPNDGSVNFPEPTSSGQECHQTVVPLNGCTDNKGYPMGMLCSICCDCTADFVKEMKNSVGFKKGYSP